MERILTVIQICLPVFAVIALGKWLSRRGTMQEPHREFILTLVYWLALPALLLPALAKQNIVSLGDPGFLIGASVPILLTAAIFVVIARLLGFRGAFAAAIVICAFWANTAYMGFPFAQNAFGDIGFQAAAQFNSIGMMLMITFGFFIIGLYTGGAEGHGVIDSMRTTFRKISSNPIILASFSGIVISVIVHLCKLPDGGSRIPGAVFQLARLADGILHLVGIMGLPLALIALGGALKWKTFTGNLLPLALVVAGKMVLLPLISFLLFRYGFPATPAHVQGVVVLLSGMPTAIVAYVVSRQIGVEDSFVGAIVVVSTVISTLTVPVWVYLVI